MNENNFNNGYNSGYNNGYNQNYNQPYGVNNYNEPVMNQPQPQPKKESKFCNRKQYRYGFITCNKRKRSSRRKQGRQQFRYRKQNRKQYPEARNYYRYIKEFSSQTS